MWKNEDNAITQIIAQVYLLQWFFFRYNILYVEDDTVLFLWGEEGDHPRKDVFKNHDGNVT